MIGDNIFNFQSFQLVVQNRNARMGLQP